MDIDQLVLRRRDARERALWNEWCDAPNAKLREAAGAAYRAYQLGIGGETRLLTAATADATRRARDLTADPYPRARTERAALPARIEALVESGIDPDATARDAADRAAWIREGRIGPVAPVAPLSSGETAAAQ